MCAAESIHAYIITKVSGFVVLKSNIQCFTIAFFTINLKKHYSFYSFFVVVEKKAENIIIRDGEQDEKNDDDDSTRWWSAACCLQEKVHLHQTMHAFICVT